MTVLVMCETRRPQQKGTSQALSDREIVEIEDENVHSAGALEVFGCLNDQNPIG